MSDTTPVDSRGDEGIYYGDAGTPLEALRNIARDLPSDARERVSSLSVDDLVPDAGIGSIASVLLREDLPDRLRFALENIRDTEERGQVHGASAGGAQAFGELGGFFLDLIRGESGGGGRGSRPDQHTAIERGRAVASGKRPWADPAREGDRFSGWSEQAIKREVQKLKGMSPAERARVQEMMVRAGALTGDFDYGGYDNLTENSFLSIIDFADAHGLRDLEEAAAEMQEARLWAEEQGLPWGDVHPGASREGTDATQQRFVQPVYERPDPARLRNDVREMFQGTVGREPSDEELDRFVNMLAGADRESFDAETEKARRDFEAAQEESQRIQQTSENMTTAEQILEGTVSGGHPGQPTEYFDPAALERRTATPEAGGGGGPVGGGEVQSVDPMARFEEELNRHLRGERRGQEEADEQRAGTQLASRAFSRIGQAMGGA